MECRPEVLAGFPSQHYEHAEKRDVGADKSRHAGNSLQEGGVERGVGSSKPKDLS